MIPTYNGWEDAPEEEREATEEQTVTIQFQLFRVIKPNQGDYRPEYQFIPIGHY